MAVTFDSTFEKANASTSSPFSFVSNAGTVTGSVGSNSNRILIGYLAFNDNVVSSVGMTWNSVAMTAIGTAQSLASDYLIFLFGLIAPATGAQTLGCTFTGGPAPIVLGAGSFYNCDQSTGWQNFAKATATSTAPSATITSANGNMATGAVVVNNGSIPSSPSGTSLWTEGAINGNYAAQYRASTTSSTVLSWTSSSVEWGVVGVDLIAVGAATVVPQIMNLRKQMGD